MTNEQTNMTSWAQDEVKKLDQERADKRKEKGYREFYNWRKGENKFQIIVSEPMREIDGKFGKQKIFAAKAGEETVDLAINVKSPVYRIVLRGVAEGKTKFNILKSGDGKDTKYELLEVSE